jgi:hypothetical protein
MNKLRRIISMDVTVIKDIESEYKILVVNLEERNHLETKAQINV